MKTGTGKLMISIVILHMLVSGCGVSGRAQADPAPGWQQLDEAAVSGRYEANFTDDTQGDTVLLDTELAVPKNIVIQGEAALISAGAKRTEIKNPFRLKFVEEDGTEQVVYVNSLMGSGVGWTGSNSIDAGITLPEGPVKLILEKPEGKNFNIRLRFTMQEMTEAEETIYEDKKEYLEQRDFSCDLALTKERKGKIELEKGDIVAAARNAGSGQMKLTLTNEKGDKVIQMDTETPFNCQYTIPETGTYAVILEAAEDSSGTFLFIVY